MRADQDEHRVRGRLLERLQQRVLRGRVHALRVDEDPDLPPGAERLERDLLLEVAHRSARRVRGVADRYAARLPLRPQPVHVGVVVLLDVEALLAEVAGVPPLRRAAVEELGEVLRRELLPDRLGAVEEPRVRDPPLPDAPRQEVDRRLLPPHRSEPHRRTPHPPPRRRTVAAARLRIDPAGTAATTPSHAAVHLAKVASTSRITAACTCAIVPAASTTFRRCGYFSASAR